MALELLTLADSARWEQAVRSVDGWDVYWLPGYARSWERNGDGAARLALFQEAGEMIAYPFLERPIPDAEGTDISSLYGYGGPLFSPGARELLPRFYAAFGEACRSRGAVSEFVRFHPLLRNHEPAPADTEVVWKGRTVWMDLAGAHPADGLKREARNRVRKAEKAGLTTRLTAAPDDISAFVKLYRETMDRLGARPYYHFSDAYWRSVREDLSQHLLLGEVLLEAEVVAAGLFLCNGRFVHYHLGGSAAEHLPLAPNNKLFHDVALWGHERGLSQLHLGGGLRPDDSLFRFKATFSPYTADFYVGHRVFEHKRYAELEQARRAAAPGRSLQSGYFPAYRAPWST